MELSLFDLHCDTAHKMEKEHLHLDRNGLAVSLECAAAFQRYVQIMALWTDSSLSDEEGWGAYGRMLTHLKKEVAAQPSTVSLTAHYREPLVGEVELMLGVEDARILCADLERLDVMARDGVRILTPLWANTTCIGGAHNTSDGLTPFGNSAVRKAMTLGMINDISHASLRSADEILAIAEEHRLPVIATHSNAYEVCPVSRNLRRHQALAIQKSGGIVGLNLYTRFLRADGNARLADLLFHIDHFLSMGMEDHLCLGCDMDGADMPPEIQGVASLPLLADLLLAHNYAESLVHKLFYGNAARFASTYLKSKTNI